MAPAYQAQVFLLAQRITRLTGSSTIISLREESYYVASVQKTFTAYSNRKFHIASPRFRTLIANRIRVALRWLQEQDEAPPIPASKGAARIDLDRASIHDFLRIVEYSIFESNRTIARFIEALCFGNMRLALEMFATFLGSGATDVDKMLRIYRREGAYYVAFHEFVKSIMLGDRKYYRESHSRVMNLFDCGPEKNASHFTTIRVLRFLAALRGQSDPAGQGHCDVDRLLLTFENVFDNREDLIRSLNRLVNRQLLETDTKAADSIAGSSSVRITSAGWYYLRYLVRSFAYLDLVLQDTPLNDPRTEEALRMSVREVDNLAGRDEDKEQRMDARFGRVGCFLEYLRSEEERERKEFALNETTGDLSEPVMTPILAEFGKESEWIRRRIRENRERYREDHQQFDAADVPPGQPDEEDDQLELGLDGPPGTE
ncbi:MAG: hypothetical protein AB7O37_22935 [Vicinamibacteria bacterium]